MMHFLWNHRRQVEKSEALCEKLNPLTDMLLQRGSPSANRGIVEVRYTTAKSKQLPPKNTIPLLNKPISRYL